MCLHGSENTSCFPVGTCPPGALSLESKRLGLDPSLATLWLPVWCSVRLEPHVKYKCVEGMNEQCVTLGKSPNLSVPQFLPYKVGIIVFTSKRCRED